MDTLAVTLQNSDQIVPITSKVFSIGRATSNDMMIKHPSISKDHAYIEIKQNRAFLKDLQSLNGTKVNDVRIDKGGVVELFNGDTVEFGKTEIVYKVNVRNHQKEPTLTSSVSRKDKKINLKDMFVSAEVESIQQQPSNLKQTDPMVFEKRIKVSNIKESVKDDRSQSSYRPSIPQKSSKVGPVERRIQLGNLNQFLRDIEIPEQQQVKLQQLRKSHEAATLKQKQLDLIKQQNRKIQIQKATLQAERIQAQREVLRQKQLLQKQMEEERVRIQQEKEAFMKKMESDYQQRLHTEIQSRNQQALIEQQAREKEMSEKKGELEKLKKEAEKQAQAMAKEYEAIYRDTLEKTRKSVLRFQQLERDLQNSIKSRQTEKDQLQAKLKQQQNSYNQTKKIFAEINSKNKALILYASELQTLIQKTTPPSKIRQESVQQEKEVEGFRKLMINALKLEADEGWRKYLSVNSRVSNQVKMIKDNIQKVAEMKEQLFQYIQREKEAEAKWEVDLLQNTELSEKIKNLTVELNRGNDNLQIMQRDNTKRLCDYHMQFIKLLRKANEEKRRAAQYLVEQLVMIEKQKHNVVLDNEKMHLRIQELISNMESTRNQSKHLSELLFGEVQGQGPYPQLQSLKIRIMDLTDQIQQIQINSTVNSLLRLTREFETAELSVADQRERHNKLTQKINKALGSGQGLQSILDFFANMLLERDSQIQKIHSEQQQIKRQTQVLSSETQQIQQGCKEIGRTYQRFKQSQMDIAKQMLSLSKK